jgi:hypothetical protein
MTVAPHPRRWPIGVFLAFLLMVLLGCLENWFAPSARNGMYYQKWSSEHMMQTVSIQDLRDEPFSSLWNLHIQPPALDGTRALLAWAWHSERGNTHQLLRRVDSSLYVLWIVLYGLAGFLMYLWLSEMAGIWFAFALTILFFLHPASIFYATFLETTFLSATLILGLYYLLWQLKEKKNVSMWLLVFSFVFLFLTRSLFQWPFLVLLALSLIFMKVPRRKIVFFVAVAGMVVGLYTAKQVYQFGLTGTTSFSGFNFLSSVGVRVDYGKYALHLPAQADSDSSSTVYT